MNPETMSIALSTGQNLRALVHGRSHLANGGDSDLFHASEDNPRIRDSASKLLVGGRREPLPPIKSIIIAVCGGQPIAVARR